jgi:hypothetical protein
MKLFKDRTEAGKRLGETLARYAGRTGVVVLGLPRRRANDFHEAYPFRLLPRLR